MLIDISRIAALDAIRDRGDAIEIGAAVTQNTLMAWPQLATKAAASRRRAAVRRSFPDPQQGHRVRLDRACRSEFGTAAGARGARRRGGAALDKGGERVLAAEAISAGHADHRARRRRTDRGGALSGDRGQGRRLSTKWRAATATSPSSRSRRSPTDDSAVPARRRRHGRPADGAPSIARRRCCLTPIAAWADELEGYEDLHASAAMRRDLFRNLGAARDRGGHPMRRVNTQQKRARRADAQRPQALGRSRAAHAADRFPPPCARRHRHPCRLRARRLRRLHRADRRRGAARVPDACGAGRRPRGDDRGIACRARRHAQPAASRRSATITRCNAASARRAF